MCDLLWSEPNEEIKGWLQNASGNSVTFGAEVVSRFLERHEMDLIVRGHKRVGDGYEFFAKRQLVTIWGAPGDNDEYSNDAAVLNIDESLLCSFQVPSPWTCWFREGRSKIAELPLSSTDLETSGIPNRGLRRW